MKNKINQEINVDKIVERIYNDNSIPKFTYEDFIKYQSIFHPEDKIEDEIKLESTYILQEEKEKYEHKNINNEHDKVFRTILSDKKEAVIFINKTLNLKLEEKDLEKYKENFITENLINKETDIVYKIKNRKVFILIEHQTVNILLKDKTYTQEQKDFLVVMLDLILRRKINDDKITNKLIGRLSRKEEKEMLAILDAIDEENERIFNEGKEEGKKQIAIKMIKKKIPIETIIEITGLTEKEIKKL